MILSTPTVKKNHSQRRRELRLICNAARKLDALNSKSKSQKILDCVTSTRYDCLNELLAKYADTDQVHVAREASDRESTIKISVPSEQATFHLPIDRLSAEAKSALFFVLGTIR